jgi:hypothetical protein
MGAPKKLEKPIHVTTILETSQHERLRSIAFQKQKPMASLLREAVENLIKQESCSSKKTE